MHIDHQRIQTYLYDIKKNTIDLEDLLKGYDDGAILQNPIVFKAIKYTLIEIAEAIANTLQHILARGMGRPVSGYIDTLVKARETGIISADLFSAFKPFFEFRNALIHRYWTMDDTLILKNLRTGYKDFYTFIDEVEKQILSK
jgi:uncharacterized protein YutE (UPF0331/DUF86 family)